MITTVIITLVICILGGGGFYVLWLLTAPKKMTWIAKVYQIAEGVKPPVTNSKGVIISNIKLNDLRPYTRDILERVDKKPGITIYRLQKLNKVTPEVTSDVVDFWGEKNKEVSVLLFGDSCTLIKKGYSQEIGQAVFSPVGHDRMTMITGELAIRKERLKDEKSILEAITPWIITGICMLALVGIAYFTVTGFVKISENNLKSTELQTQNIESTNILLAKIYGIQTKDLNNLNTGIKKEQPPQITDG